MYQYLGCYPARLKKVLIVTAPLWFKAPFKVKTMTNNQSLSILPKKENIFPLQTELIGLKFSLLGNSL